MAVNVMAYARTSPIGKSRNGRRPCRATHRFFFLQILCAVTTTFAIALALCMSRDTGPIRHHAGPPQTARSRARRAKLAIAKMHLAMRFRPRLVSRMTATLHPPRGPPALSAHRAEHEWTSHTVALFPLFGCLVPIYPHGRTPRLCVPSEPN